MKKKKFIILISVLAVVIAAFGCFAYMYYTATTVKNIFYRYFIADNEDVERLGRLPEHIELVNDSKPGYTINFQDYTFTLSGYDNAAIENMHNSDTGSIYSVNKEKNIYFKEWVTMLIGSNIFRDDPELLAETEKVTGRNINTLYDYWEASFFCTPDDYTMFDAGKNKIVSMLLECKNENVGDTCYRFDNGIIKGFICATTSAGGPEDSFINVFFSNCDVPDTTDIPNSYYMIIFTGFSTEEVKDILGTVIINNTNQ